MLCHKAVSSIAIATSLVLAAAPALADGPPPAPMMAPPAAMPAPGPGPMMAAPEDYADSYGYQYAGPPPGAAPYGYGQPYAAPAAGNYAGYERRDPTGEIVGGVVGGAGGAVAGTFIAGHGSRLAGGLIGGGLGAIAGGVIGALLTSHHHHTRGPAPMAYNYTIDDQTVTYRGTWSGSMTGSWNGGPIQTWRGSYDDRSGKPEWRGHFVTGGMGAPRPAPRMGYGYGYGYGYAAPMMQEMWVPTQPVITKTVATRVSYVDVPVRTRYVYKRVVVPVHHVVHHVRRAPACICGS